MGFPENGMHGVPLACLQEGTMRRERAMKIVLVVVGLLFTAGVVPLTTFSRESLRCP
jgi:hypothetical protein